MAVFIFNMIFHVSLFHFISTTFASPPPHRTISMNIKRVSAAATVLGNQIIIAGGLLDRDSSGGSGGARVASDMVEIYDIRTETWSSGHWLSEPRFSLTATSTSTHAFFAGGAQFNISQQTGAVEIRTLKNVDIYCRGGDGGAGEWKKEELLSGRMLLASTAVGPLVFFAGGLTIDRGNLIASKVVEVYNTSRGEWVLPPLQLPLERAHLVAATVGTTVVFAGGFSSTGQRGQLPTLDLYDTVRGSWTTVVLHSMRCRVGMAVVGYDIVLAGGVNYFTGLPSSMVEMYNIVTGNWSFLPQLKKPRVQPIGVGWEKENVVQQGGTAAAGYKRTMMHVTSAGSGESYGVVLFMGGSHNDTGFSVINPPTDVEGYSFKRAKGFGGEGGVMSDIKSHPEVDSPMNEARTGFATVQAGGLVFLIGGAAGLKANHEPVGDTSSTIDIYDLIALYFPFEETILLALRINIGAILAVGIFVGIAVIVVVVKSIRRSRRDEYQFIQ